MKIRIRRKRKSMLLAAPKGYLREDVGQDEEIDNKLPPEISTGSEEVSQESESDLQNAIEHRDRLIDALAKLTAKERLQVLRNPCEMSGLYSINKAAEMLDTYSKALKGELNDKE
jgi:hypothetical protein